MEYVKHLENLGLSQKEVCVYIKALEMGQFSIASISHETNIKRPTCYVVVDSLIQRGLISLVPQGRKSLYCAESPEILIDDMEKNVALARSVVPYLQKIRGEKSAVPVVKFFTGRRGIEAIYKDILKEKKGVTLCSMTPADQLTNMVGKDFFDTWVKSRIEKGILSRVLVPLEDKGKDMVVTTDEKSLRETRYLPKEFIIKTTFGTYGNKVAFFSSRKDNMSFIITSNEFKETIQNFFDYLWHQSIVEGDLK
jgi:HTH-type transcriptional regulator, sugar sensing transcriptional regulator